MKKLIRSKHFISAIGFAVICTSLFLLFSIFRSTDAQTNPITLGSDKQSPVSGSVELFASFASDYSPSQLDLTITFGQYKVAKQMNPVDVALGRYQLQWDTDKFLNGIYTLKAEHSTSNGILHSNELVIEVRHLNTNIISPKSGQNIMGNFEIRTESNYENAPTSITFFNQDQTVAASPSTLVSGTIGITPFDSTSLANGNYILKVDSTKNDMHFSNTIPVVIENVTKSIKIESTFSYPVSNTINLVVATTPLNAGIVKMILNGPINKTLKIDYDTTVNKYKATLNTLELPNASYTIKAYSELFGAAINDQINIIVDNKIPVSTSTSSNEINTASTTTLNSTVPLIYFVYHPSVVSSPISLTLKANLPPDSVAFKLFNTLDSGKIIDEKTLPGSGLSSFNFSLPKTLLNGKYKIKAEAKFSSIYKYSETTIEYKAAIINNTSENPNEVPKTISPPSSYPEKVTVPAPTPTVSPTVKPTAPPILSPIIDSLPTKPKAPIPAPIQTENIATKPIIPTISKPTQITPMQAIDRPISLGDQVTDQVCLNEGIKKVTDCKNYLSLALVCRKNKMNTREKCDSFLDLPFKCQESGITDMAGCQNYLRDISLPPQCFQEGIFDQRDCRDFIMKKNLPGECVQAGVNDPGLCQELLNKKPKKEKPISNKCLELGIIDQKLCDSYTKWSEVNQECDLVLIDDKNECRKYLLNSFGAKICKEVGISEAENCENFIFNKISKELVCSSGNEWECSLTIDDKLGAIVSTQSKYDRMEKALNSLKQGTSIKDLREKIGATTNLLPLNNDNVKLKLINTKKQIIVNEEIMQTSPVAIMLDSDGDGLSDDMEKRIGSDPNNIDTDGDNYDDFMEYKNGYNPLGTGKLKNFQPAPIDEAIMTRQALEHPKTSLNIDTSLNVKEASLDSKTIKGQGQAGVVYTLYVYSDLPIVTTVQADEFGNWFYVFQESMVDGHHEIYFALNDNTGKIISRSNPFNLFIKEAKAVSIEDYINGSGIENKSQTSNMIMVYIIVSLLSTLAGIGAFIAYLKFYKKNLKS